MLTKQHGKEQGEVSLRNVFLLYLVFRDVLKVFLPFKIIVVYSPDSIAAFKYWSKQIMLNQTLGLKKHPCPVA